MKIGPDDSLGGTVLDIQVELDYWREAFPGSEFSVASLAFERFIPTIKFGYDCYLLYPSTPLVELLPDLRARYFAQVSTDEQVDWRWADQIIRYTWRRMRSLG